jgi:glycosyltransferase involved in cell wall biosynthesis
MIVLQLGPYPPPHGGVQTNLVAIREHLRGHQIGAPVINLTRHRRADADEVFYPSTALAVVRLLFALPADIIHLHIGGQLTARLLALILVCTLVPGRRVVLTFHSGGYPNWDENIAVSRRSLRGFILRRLDAVIAVNTQIAEMFHRFGVAADRVHVICPYSPVSVRDDLALPDEIRTFCEAHSPLLTTIGLLESEYDLALQITSMTQIRRTSPTAGLVIIGSGSLEADLRRLIASEPAGKHVLLCGDVPHAVTLRVLSQSDVFLRTTHYDGDSVSVREALQLGIPVLATDNGMRPRGVHLISASNKEALSDAVARLVAAGRVHDATAESPVEHLDEVLHLYSSLTGRELDIRRPTLPTSSVL